MIAYFQKSAPWLQEIELSGCLNSSTARVVGKGVTIGGFERLRLLDAQKASFTDILVLIEGGNPKEVIVLGENNTNLKRIKKN